MCAKMANEKVLESRGISKEDKSIDTKDNRRLKINEIIKNINKFHNYTEFKLEELTKICSGKTNEQ